jgi:hypothetical protein
MNNLTEDIRSDLTKIFSERNEVVAEADYGEIPEGKMSKEQANMFKNMKASVVELFKEIDKLEASDPNRDYSFLVKPVYYTQEAISRARYIVNVPPNPHLDN